MKAVVLGILGLGATAAVASMVLSQAGNIVFGGLLILAAFACVTAAYYIGQTKLGGDIFRDDL